MVADDGEKKLPTFKELPTSAKSDENEKEPPETVIVDYGGGIIVHSRRPDGSLDEGHEFSTDELIPDEDEDAGVDERIRKAWKKAKKIKTLDVETLEAAQDILEADSRPLLSAERTQKTHLPVTSDAPELSFSKSDLDNYAALRKEKLAKKSQLWIDRDATELWEFTKGEVSQRSLTTLRQNVLSKYQSADSHSKVLSFATSFLKFLATTRSEPRYQSFSPYLERPKTVKVRKNVTERIVIKEDIENVLRYIRNAEEHRDISAERSAHYAAFITFGAFTGQRTDATMKKLTVGQFREALQSDKPVLTVKPSQDKIRMEHYVPLHPQVVKAMEAVLGDRKNKESAFGYHSFQMWLKRQKIPMSHFKGHFVLGDLRKFAEQQGDVIEWEPTNRAYILTHGVSGVQWSHYKHARPEPVYDIYMKYWGEVSLKI
ncbi:MAG: hypothetical protein ABSB81_11555 [Halobacteriota archaeon]|jgi:integrase